MSVGMFSSALSARHCGAPKSEGERPERIVPGAPVGDAELLMRQYRNGEGIDSVAPIGHHRAARRIAAVQQRQ
jgi:hypothetical protein